MSDQPVSFPVEVNDTNSYSIGRDYIYVTMVMHTLFSQFGRGLLLCQQTLVYLKQMPAIKLKNLRSILLFLGIVVVLQLAWEASRGTLFERWVIDVATVQPSAWLINLLWPLQASVDAKQNHLVSSQGQLNILNGCEGLDAIFLLVAAFLAYPFDLIRRLVGVVLGVLVVYLANQIRILVLWNVHLFHRDLFGLMHGVIMPLALIAVCMLYFLIVLPKQHE